MLSCLGRDPLEKGFVPMRLRGCPAIFYGLRQGMTGSRIKRRWLVFSLSAAVLKPRAFRRSRPKAIFLKQREVSSCQTPTRKAAKWPGELERVHSGLSRI